jgi:hypothetical protein
MADMPLGRRTILVDDEVFDVLSRTAETRKTDANAVLRHLLLEVPAPAQLSGDEDDEDDEDDDEE